MKKILSFCAVLLMACSVNAQAQTNAQQNVSDAKAGQAQLLPWETPRDTTCHEVLLETTLGISVWPSITIRRTIATTS